MPRAVKACWKPPASRSVVTSNLASIANASDQACRNRRPGRSTANSASNAHSYIGADRRSKPEPPKNSVTGVVRRNPRKFRYRMLHVTINAAILLHVTNSGMLHMANAHVNARVQKHRDALRMAGLRPVQIWVPDTRRPDFAEECRRQSRLAAKTDMADTDMQHFMDEALADVEGWTK